MNTYIFILCPPYSGSTLLLRLVSTSNAVSSLPWEGQFLPEVKKVMRQDPWNSDLKLPWQNIKEIWDRYWDQDKPLLVEKSPPHIIRTNEIVEHFNPVYFLLMVRNPYAHCEGLIRRNNWSAKEAAEFTLRCLKQQAENAEKLKNTLCFTYEELVENPELISEKIQSFLPQIGFLKYDQSFKVHSIDGALERGFVNLNQKKIDNLSINDLILINKVLKKNPDVMNYWGYQYYEPSLNHALAFFKTKRSSLLPMTLSKGKQVITKAIKTLKRYSN
ncbi:MAG: sulfotransferase [Cyanobacteria bacterium P01_G01_bin.49]